MELNKKNISIISDEMLEALKPVLERHGLTVAKAGGTFADLEATLKFRIAGKSEGGLTQREVDYDQFKAMLGLPDRGTKFRSGLKEYTVFGIDLKRRSRNIICVRTDDGKQYLFADEDVKRVTTKSVIQKAIAAAEVIDGVRTITTTIEEAEGLPNLLGKIAIANLNAKGEYTSIMDGIKTRLVLEKAVA